MFAAHFDFTKPLLWTVDGFVSAEDCAALIARADAGPWLEATVNSVEGRIVRRDVRDSDTFVFDDEPLANALFDRLRPPAEMMRMRPLGLVPRLRVYRYRRGQRFGLHHDQTYQGPNGARSLLTMMVYLNDDFDGGETSFPEQDQIVRPKTGMALLFQHMLLHEGCEVRRGTKYALRTDVLYHP